MIEEEIDAMAPLDFLLKFCTNDTDAGMSHSIPVNHD